MAENKMKEVAKLLGLELEEEFIIDESKTKYKLTVHGLFYYASDIQDWFCSSRLDKLLLGRYQITKPILDKEEKEYLSAVIKPFRNRIIYIMKTYEDDQSEFLEIRSKHYDANKIGDELIMLPSFKKGTMYKCMRTDKEYTLEELGL